MSFVLPEPREHTSGSLIDCIASRRSVRDYSNSSLSVSELSQLLWSAQGQTGSDQLRTTPSAHGFYPLQLHILVRRISGLEPGIYEYLSMSHSLRRLTADTHEASLATAGIGDQPWLDDAALVIGVAARLNDTVRHFESQRPAGTRGIRYVYMEAGALSQNVHLQATDLGLGCVLVAGFIDAQVERILQLPAGLEPTVLMCIGRQRSRQ